MQMPDTPDLAIATDRAEVIGPDALTPDVVAAWSALGRRALEPNPFAEPEFVVPALRHLGAGRVGVAVAMAGDRMIACTPVRRLRRWRKVPLPASGIWAHEQNPLGTPLLDDHPRAAELLLRAVGSTTAAPLLTFDDITRDGPVYGALVAALEARDLRPVIWESHERALLDKLRHDSVGQLLAGRHRRLRSKRRALQRELRDELRAVDRCDDPSAVATLLRMEADGWKGDAGTAMACEPGHAAFFRDVCRGFAAAGRLQLLSLEAGGTSVAMQCNIIAGDTLFHFKSAYDERHRRHSPGLQLLVDMLHVFADSELRRLDSCTDPDNGVFNDLLPDRLAITRPVVAAGYGRRVLRPVLQAGATLRHRLRARRSDRR